MLPWKRLSGAYESKIGQILRVLLPFSDFCPKINPQGAFETLPSVNFGEAIFSLYV